jgi:hypothetical protein
MMQAWHRPNACVGDPYLRRRTSLLFAEAVRCVDAKGTKVRQLHLPTPSLEEEAGQVMSEFACVHIFARICCHVAPSKLVSAHQIVLAYVSWPRLHSTLAACTACAHPGAGTAVVCQAATCKPPLWCHQPGELGHGMDAILPRCMCMVHNGCTINL